MNRQCRHVLAARARGGGARAGSPPDLASIRRALAPDDGADRAAMCWSAGVSLAFGLVGIACAWFLYTVGKAAEEKKKPSIQLPGGLTLPNLWTADCKWHALWVLNIACVELSEFVIWLNVLPFEDELMGGTSCPAWNKAGTFGVFFFGFANWSWLIGVWCHGTTSASQPLRRKVFKLWRTFAILTSIFFILQLAIGEIFEIGVRSVANLTSDEVDLHVACST